MRALPLALLIVAATLLPATAQATCTADFQEVRNGANRVWVQQLRCDDARSATVRVDVFSPLSSTGSITLLAVTLGSSTTEGAFGSYTREDGVTLTTAGRESSARLWTSEDTQGRMSCQLSITTLGIGAARNAPLPACAPGDAVLP